MANCCPQGCVPLARGKGPAIAGVGGPSAPTVGAARRAARQMHGQERRTPNVSRLTPKDTICRGQMLLNVKIRRLLTSTLLF